MNTRSFPQFIGVALAVVLAVGGLGYALPYRLYALTERLAASIQASRVRIKFLEQATLRAKANEASLAASASTLDKVRSSFFNRESPLTLIESLEEFAKIADVDLKIDLANASQNPPSFRLAADGSIEGALMFLRLLENAPTVLMVETMTFDRSGRETAGNSRATPNAPREASLVVLISGLAVQNLSQK